MNEFPAIKTVKPRREAAKTAPIKGALSGKKKYGITTDETLKEKRNFKKFSMKDKKR